MNQIPTFATVGAVNHGKSSVVSTLAENDQIRISPLPGETIDCKRFALGDFFVFYDTPGFQNAAEALESLRPAESAPDPLQVFRDFVSQHRRNPDFHAEITLFEPLIEGAGLIYVVDGSRPVLPINEAEMQILRLSGAPRLAIINRTSKDDHVRAWKQRLGLHFNAVREFNAHHATFADRIELLETLAGIEQAWKPKLSQAIQILREEWTARLEECAALMVEMLREALPHQESQMLPSELRSAEHQLGQALKARYLSAITAIESRAHYRIIELFSHHLVRADSSPQDLLADQLFSEESWRCFGLNLKQLVAAGALTGAAAGAGVDALTLGHTLLAGSALGATAGAAGALLLGKTRPQLSVQFSGLPLQLPKSLASLLPRQLRFAGRSLSVGPCRAPNFPWILLERAIGTFAYLLNRAHGRRDQATLHADTLKSVLEQHQLSTAQWDSETRSQFQKAFVALSNAQLSGEQLLELQLKLQAQLQKVAQTRLSFDPP